VEHASEHSAAPERLSLREHVGGLYTGAQVVGIAGLVLAVLLGYFAGNEFHTFFNSYLIGFMFYMAIAMGGLFFVLVQHATKAAWSVNVRRIAEWYASTVPVMAVLGVPILVAVLAEHGPNALYPWTITGWNLDRGFKGWWLSPGFFVGRAIFNFIVWSIIALWYWKQSVRQDESGDINISRRMQYRAPVCLIIFGLTLTCMAWDWLMSLDPIWYSTIFGVYYFAGCALAIFASIIITARFLQSRGLLLRSVTTEHYHDLGKFLFAFTFFWGYIAFSQFMLQWYGNIPDETEWFKFHGASTVVPNAFSAVLIILLFGHFLFPFPGLLSRHVKRNPKGLLFCAFWMLAFCWFDLYWIVAPELDRGNLHLSLLDIAEHLSIFVGIGGIFVSVVMRRAAQASIRAMRDPRLDDSLAYENL